MSVKETLKSVPFFNHFGDEQLDEMIAIGGFESFASEHTLFRQGDPADSLYVILSGEVCIFSQDQAGNEVELSRLPRGNFFGELALVDGGTRSATVRIAADSELFVLSRANFIQLLSKSPQLISEVLAGISDKIRTSNEKFFREMMDKQRLQSEMEIERHRSLAQMVAGVAHEINTPLGIVNTSASMIGEYLSPEFIAHVARDEDTRQTLDDILEAATLMQNNIARANRLIQSFKSISVNQITDTLDTLPMRTLLEEILDLFKIKAKQVRITMALHLTPAAEGQVWTGYPGYLSQILMNLLGNAERYAYPNGSGGHIDIRLDFDTAKDQFILAVQDYGVGIPAEHLSRVFEVFFTTGRDRGGTGLGMAIVHNLVTSAMKGSISIDSIAGEGTTVEVCLPRHISPSELLA